jgi:hypothetical protein
MKVTPPEDMITQRLDDQPFKFIGILTEWPQKPSFGRVRFLRLW